MPLFKEIDMPCNECKKFSYECECTSPETEVDMVNHPLHYTSSEATCDKCGDCIECIEVTRHMPFNIGNAVKYLWRFNDKNGLEDLKKAVWYIQDYINEKEKEKKSIVVAKNVMTHYSDAIKILGDK
jgi:hypothetical protein